MMQDRVAQSRFRPTALATAATAVFFTAVPGLAAIQSPGQPIGGEGFSTFFSPPGEKDAAVALDADGDMIIVYTGYTNGETDGDDDGIRVLKVDSFGRFLGPGNVVDAAGTPRLVNTTTTGLQQLPQVAVDASGDFVVVWESISKTTHYEIYMQRYSPQFRPVGAEVQITAPPIGALANHTEPTVAMDVDGDYVVAWVDSSANYGIRAQRFDKSGNPVGTQFNVPTSTGFTRTHPRAAMDSTGEFVVTWTSSFQDSSGLGIFARRFNAAGTGQGAEFQVNEESLADQLDSVVGIDNSGNFVIAWQNNPEGGGLFTEYQRYAANGAKIGTETKAEEGTITGDERAPSIAMSRDGDFVIAWSDDEDSGGRPDLASVRARRFDSNGTPLGNSFGVNTVTVGAQALPAVGMDADGDFSIAFLSNYVNGATGGVAVVFQRYTGNQAVDLSPSLLGVSATSPVTNSTVDYTYRIDNLHSPSSTPGFGVSTGITARFDLGHSTFNGISGAGWSCTTSVICSDGNHCAACMETDPLVPGDNTQFVLSTTTPATAETVLTTAVVSGNQTDAKNDNTLTTSVTVVAPDTHPNAFSFTPKTDVALGATVTSNTIAISGINVATPISVAGGSYSLNGNPFTTAAGTIHNNDTVQVRHTASANPGTSVTTTLTVGDVDGTFTSTTIDADTDPDPFTFPTLTGVPANTFGVSASRAITGINTTTGISISGGGQFSINGNPFSSIESTVVNNDTVRVRVTAPAAASTSATTTLQVGGLAVPFTVTTADDTTPDPITFAPHTGVQLNSVQTTGAAPVTGISVAVPISITGGSYAINGAGFVTSAGTINSGDTVTVRQTASANPSTKTTATLTVGSLVTTFDVTTLDDVNPNPFSFNAQTGVATSTVVTSSAATIQGISAPAPISITGGSYSIDGNPFTTASGTIGAGSTVVLRQTSSANPSTKTTATLTVGGGSANFDVTTADDTTPNAFSFNGQNGVATSTVITSNTVTIQGISVPVPISVTGGRYSINGGVFTNAGGTVSAGQTVAVQLTSSANPSTTTSATLTVGSGSPVSATFQVKTADDTVPDAFSFPTQTGVATSTVITSNTVTIQGISVPVPISIAGGTYRINAGTFTNAAGTVSSGDTVVLHLISSANASTTTSATLTVGSGSPVSATFQVKTADDTTPDPFPFTPATGVPLNSVQTSNTRTISGISVAVPISVTGGLYSLNGVAFTNGAGTLNAGDTVAVRQTASATPSTTTTATLTIGTVSSSYAVTTVDDTLPDAFVFNARTGITPGAVVTSNPVTIQGISVTVPISITAGGAYSINAGAFTTTPSTIHAGDSVVVRQTASANPSTTTSVTLTVGSGSGTFTVTTVDDTTPDAITFATQTDVATSTVITSNPATIQGVSVPVPISITGGTYRINAGGFTNAAGTVNAGDTVVLHLTSSANASTTTTATLTVGTLSTTFQVKTADDTTPNAFTFNARTGITPGAVVTSNTVTVKGISVPVPISVTNGTYRINGSDFTSTPGTISANDTVAVQQTASSSASVTTTATLTVGTFSAGFTITTADDTKPDPITFVTQTGVATSTVITSNAATIQGISVAVPISITGGTYSLNGGGFTNAAGSAQSGDSVVLHLVSSATASTTTSASLTVGSLTTTFQVKTADDITPDDFSFVAQAGAATGSVHISNAVTISGISVDVPASITGGTFAVNAGPFSGVTRNVSAGSTIRVRQTASSQPTTTTTATLTVGTFSAGFDVTTADDKTPDPFSFATQTDVATGAVVLSNPANISGISVPVGIAVTGGQYSIDGSAFTATAGTVSAGSSVIVRQTASADPSKTTTATLTVGTFSADFQVKTADDTTPNAIVFNPQANLAPGTVATSNTRTVKGISVPVAISVTGGSYSIDGGGFTTTPGTVSAGSTVAVRQTASSVASTTTTATLTVGSLSADFKVTTADDKTPDAFSFTPQTGVSPGTLHVSNPVTITGISVPVQASIAGGTFSVDGGGFTAAARTVSQDSVIRVRQTSSADASTTTTATLTVGTFSAGFDVRTADDLTPDPIVFPAQTNVPVGTLRTSTPEAITGISTPAPISVIGGSYSIDGAAFTAAAGTVGAGSTVRVQQTASATASTTTIANLTVGTVSAAFRVTTADDVIPDAFSFAAKTGVALNSVQTSAPATITGISVAVPIGITGGTYSIDGGAFTSAAGTIGSGSQVVVRQTASSSFSAATTATLTVGGVSADFKVTTLDDTEIDPIAFTSVTNAATGSTQTSNAAIITGNSVPVPISVTGGKYNINGGAFTAAAGTVAEFDVVRVQQVASSQPSTTTVATLTIGSISAGYSVTTADDVHPDLVPFTAQTNVPLGSVRTSNVQTVTGISVAVPISIAGGSYSIDGGAFTSAAGMVSNNSTVAVKQTASTSVSTTTTATLTVGDVSVGFSVTTEPQDITPDAFTFAPQTDVPFNSVRVSNEVTITGINVAAPVSITGGKFSIDGGTFTNAARTINANSTIKVRTTASGAPATPVTATLTIGTVSRAFTVTTEAADTTPDDFSFGEQDDVAFDTVVTSAPPQPITGINVSTPVSIAGGKYSVNGGAFKATAGMVVSGDNVVVRQTSSPSPSTTTTATLTVGTVSRAFVVKTVAADIHPDPFAFGAQTDVPFDTLEISAPASVSGINVAAPISVSGGAYSIDGKPFTSQAGQVIAGDTVRARVRSATGPSATTTATVTIGDASASFVVTTEAADTTPDPFPFAEQDDVGFGTVHTSNTASITGMNVAAPISITGGSYSVDGGAFRTSAGMIRSGHMVQVRQTASASPGTSTTATLTVGTVSSGFTVKTEAADPNPDAFSFAPVTGAPFGSTQTSAPPVTITGINVAAPVSISGGSYSINGGAFHGGSGTIHAGETIAVRTTASTSPSTTTSATLTIGSVSGTFSVTSEAADIMPDAFTFPAHLSVPFGSVQTSNPATIKGINVAAPISITGGTYSIDGGAFTGASGMISAGSKVTVRQTASASPDTMTTANLTVGTFTGGFVVRTEVADVDADPFGFNPRSDIALGATVTSNAATISGINVAAPISVAGGSYSINGAAFRTSASTVNSGDTVRAQLTASSSPSTVTTATVTVGATSGSFKVTTEVADTVPDPFPITPRTNAPLDADAVSNPVTITGINVAAPISVANGAYSLNGHSYTSAAGQVSPNDLVRVRVHSSALPSTQVQGTVTIGGVSSAFAVTTEAADTTPDDFSFGAVTGAKFGSVQTSGMASITGMNVAAPISVTGGTYSIDGGAFTSAAASITSGHTVQVRQTASASPSTVTTATLTVGTVSRGFAVTTEAADMHPDAFAFTAQTDVPVGAIRLSEAITVSGINVATPISVANGAYRINAGGFTSSAGTVLAGDTVVVQQISADTPTTSKTTTLTIGDRSAPFTTTTQARDDSVNPFAFMSQTSVPVNSLRVSGAIVVSGINVAVPVTVSNGEYSLNNADFTTAPGMAKGGDQIRVQHTSAATPNTSTTTTLHLGSVDGTFTSTTVAADATADAFAFVDQSGAAPGAVVTSSPITVSGINVAVPVSVTSGSYNVNGGTFTTAAGTVNNGDMVQVRTIAAAAGDTANVTLTVGSGSGSVSDTFVVTSAKAVP